MSKSSREKRRIWRWFHSQRSSRSQRSKNTQDIPTASLECARALMEVGVTLMWATSGKTFDMLVYGLWHRCKYQVFSDLRNIKGGGSCTNYCRTKFCSSRKKERRTWFQSKSQKDSERFGKLCVSGANAKVRQPETNGDQSKYLFTVFISITYLKYRWKLNIQLLT